MVMERKGGEVLEKVLFNIVCMWLKKNARLLNAAVENVSEERRFRGGIMEPPWKQTREIGTAWAKVQTCCRYVNLASQVHILSKHQ